MEFLIRIGASIVGKIAEQAIAPVFHELGYLFYYKRNLDNLTAQIEQLSSDRGRLQHSVDHAERNGEEIEADVREWLNKIGKMTEEAEVLLREGPQPITRCSSGSFPNLVSRWRLSKKAKKMEQDVKSEIQYVGRLSKVSFCPSPQSSIEIRGYETFETRVPILVEIKEALGDPNTRMIGVYGMAGVGKTMLAKEVARQAMQEKTFDEAIIVTVSQSPSLEKIQEEIAENLGLKLEEKTVPVRANRLRHRLQLAKKTLIILDDIWEKLDLHDVGIRFGNDQTGCKMLMTSRFRDVLCSDMNVEKNFHVKVLSDCEAKNLFNKIVSHSVTNYEVFEQLVIDIIAECAGLPIAIATVANALKNKDSPPMWFNALQELRMSNPVNIRGMHGKVYSSIKMSYNFLESEEARSLLLLCSLHEEDANININYLLRYCVGLDWFHGITQLEHARNKVLRLVEDLKSSCLLQDGDYDYGSRVKIHDVIRDVVLSVAFKERHMHTIRNDIELEELLTKKKLKCSTAISLLEKKNDRLPERLECPELEFFMLRDSRSFQVPDQFFAGAKKVKVLDLAFSFLEPVPSSLCFLQNLQTLCLSHSKLVDITSIGELKNLEILDLSRSSIEQLPEQLGQLSRLQLLDLRFCSKLELIYPNVLSSLTRLEELNMESSFTKWEVETVNGERRNASLTELKYLLQLTTLHVCVPDVNVLPENLFSGNLERYKVVIGDSRLQNGKLESSSPSRILKVKLKNSNLLRKGGLEMLLGSSEELYLDGLEGVNNVVHELYSGGFPKLKHFEFKNNAEIQYIVNSMELISAFKSLELLCLDKLINLERICNGKLTVDSFGRLRVVKVTKCYRLKNLVPFSIARHLEQIEVTDCKMIKEVVINERQYHNNAAVDYKIEFPQLRSLRLEQLPELTQFCSESVTSCWSGSNVALVIETAATPFFIPKVAFPKLEYLKLSAIKSDHQKLWRAQLLNELQRDNSFPKLKHLMVENAEIRYIIDSSTTQVSTHYSAFLSLESLHLEKLMKLEKICNTIKLTPQSFGKLKFVKISNCNELKNLWSFCSPANYVLLEVEEIEVSCCQKLREIIGYEREEDISQDENNHDVTLSKIDSSSQLRSLRLRSVPQLTKFSSASPKQHEQVIPNSAEPFFDGKVNFPKLATLEMLSLNLHKMWDNLLNPTSFQSLTTLLVKGCGFLKNLFPSYSVAANLAKLRLIDVRECDMMEEIIFVSSREDTNKIIFHELNVLSLTSLPKLTRFCTGISIEFPELSELSATNLPHLRTLIASRSMSTTTSTLSLFNEKVALPKLEKLNISCMDNLTTIWPHQISTTDSFGDFKVIKIYDCKNLTVMFPPYMLARLLSLRRLEIRKCGMLEEVFMIDESLNSPTLTFSNLHAIIIYGCPLKSLFPVSIAKGLLQLEKLEIKGCTIREVVSIDHLARVRDEASIPKFFFPRLTSLQLRVLPELLHFYPGLHTSEWPLLKRLKVYDCQKLRAFASDISSFQEASGQNLLDTQIQPLFLMEKVSFPNLEELTVGMLALEGVQHDQYIDLLGVEECARMVSRLKMVS